MSAKKVEQAAAKAGIATTWINAGGQEQAVSQATCEKLLAAMPAPQKASHAPLPPCKVLLQKHIKPLQIGGKGDYQWRLNSEGGKTFSGSVTAGEMLTLPRNLPNGYHQLLLSQGKKQWACRIIVAPQRCHEPAVIRQGDKLWGAIVQLYTLRSEQNWGIGDFGDLKRMVSDIAVRGGSFIGLNPIHALYPAIPESASPYSPSSRRWLNVIYIDVAAVADFHQSQAGQRWWQQKNTRQRLEKARQADWVDYATVGELKIHGLRYAWQQFSQREQQDSTRLDFEQFIRDGGQSLVDQATYDALHGQMLKEDPQRWGWPVWPEAWQHGHSDAVQRFRDEHADEVRFWLWLQWLADRQFAECWQCCQQHRMSIGLYRDLAVGVAQGGAETWCDRELYRLDASIGAPPDILGPQGQNWGLPPMDPHVLVARGYQPFIDMLRANMINCGALRIDHVMSLLRLWWIPYDETANLGAYVHYPVDDLIAILALESERQQCMVIGEDLGTVPPQIVSKLRDSGIYSWKVLYFEQEPSGRYRSPDAWPRQSMASATTHDLPTLRGFWNEGDLTLGETLGLYPDKQILGELFTDRARKKQALLDALHRAGCVAKSSGKVAANMAMSARLNRGMQRFIAASDSALLGLQPEDWLDMEKPVNVPGTTDQYPNWRRKLSVTQAVMFADASINRLLKDINARRKG
ncbi:4-alpha-glucanotransferase [Erwinia piriflorinigrans]|uniref:4-alpha-glucanotransferase n=1 Tax=Erwinia piriflorinigrans CFBP 5888 TaxID=1161919 RepID=V5ZCX7_9GAMM|nr:4-alpha-glucanotransferase [Erwinia piriflorinigrans]CCG88897.1 4-alpha-glucanotransferase (amylomaltase) [Erwinia piriflorinigrans CFBP 5888]